MNIVDIHWTILIITLNINGLNIPAETQIVRMNQKPKQLYVLYKKPNIFFLETHFKYKSTYRLKVTRWRKIHRTNINQKKVRVALLISDRTGFKAKKVIRDEEGHYMIKGSILQEDITILDVYAPNNR